MRGSQCKPSTVVMSNAGFGTANIANDKHRDLLITPTLPKFGESQFCNLQHLAGQTDSHSSTLPITSSQSSSFAYIDQ